MLGEGRSYALVGGTSGERDVAAGVSSNSEAQCLQQLSLLQPWVPQFCSGADAPQGPHDASTTHGDLVPSLPSRAPLGFGDFGWKRSMLAPKGNVWVQLACTRAPVPDFGRGEATVPSATRTQSNTA